jgi:signal peptidase I
VLRRVCARFTVIGPSMEPVLWDGDRVLVNLLAYRLRRPVRGDIVLAVVPSVPGGLTIKRVVGVRGESVTEAGGNLGSLSPGAGVSTTDATWLGPNEYFLAGDHALRSTDSRSFGPVPVRAIRGRVWYRYWPPGRRGKVR